MTKQVFILLGGLISVDGPVDSEGMEYLGRLIREQVNDVKVSIEDWGDWAKFIQPIQSANHTGDKVVLIGYSGGGSRAADLCDALYWSHPRGEIDLFVAYDPSPKWQIPVIGGNVKSVICYHNLNPMMPSPFGELGGGVIKSSGKPPAIQTIDISEQHLLVQENLTLHADTISAIRTL